MPLDHYLTLGHSGLRVSPLCLGTMTFGEEWGWGSTVAESEAILDRFLARGGNFIDTANGYTKGHSEVIIGDYMARPPGQRDRTVIATTFLTNLYKGDPNGGGAGRKSIVAACEQSLRRLRTDDIDLFWMHFWDRFTPIDDGNIQLVQWLFRNDTEADCPEAMLVEFDHVITREDVLPASA